MRKMMLSLPAVAAVVLSGCASVGPDPMRANIDYRQVARVENAAKAIGVQVYWVNYPQKLTAAN